MGGSPEEGNPGAGNLEADNLNRQKETSEGCKKLEVKERSFRPQ